MSMMGEFKTFIMQGNVVDLAVGLLLGASFGKVVDAFTKGFVEPIINMFGPGGVGLKLGPLDVGLVITAFINFLITAAVLFFIFVRPMNKLKARMDKKES